MGLVNVFFVRHAKSSWDLPNLSDLERPLNQRGHETAPKMAIFIQNLYNLGSVALISSPAKRAIETAKFFAIVFDEDENKIIQEDKLYYGGANDYINCLNSRSIKLENVFIFGHNPIMEEIASRFENCYSGPIPTCGIIYTKVDTNKFADLNFIDFKLQHVYFPKLILNS